MSTHILAIESSGRQASIALAFANGDSISIVDEQSLPTDQRAAAALHPAIQDMLIRNQLTPAELGLIAVTRGPGSFTGLRIGITAAKTLAFAIGCKLIAVSTLDTLAEQAGDAKNSETWAVLNAQRGEYFVARYHSGDSLPREQVDFDIVDTSALADRIASGALVIGPPADKIAALIGRQVEARACSPLASDVARLAWRYASRGEYDDIWQLVPDYGRLSAAEEKASR